MFMNQQWETDIRGRNVTSSAAGEKALSSKHISYLGCSSFAVYARCSDLLTSEASVRYSRYSQLSLICYLGPFFFREGSHDSLQWLRKKGCDLIFSGISMCLVHKISKWQTFALFARTVISYSIYKKSKFLEGLMLKLELNCGRHIRSVSRSIEALKKISYLVIF